jgi:hypothetical protein
MGLGTSYIDVKRSEKSKKVNFVNFLLFSFKFLYIRTIFFVFRKIDFFFAFLSKQIVRKIKFFQKQQKYSKKVNT